MDFGKRVRDHIKQHIKSALPLPHEPLWKRILVWGILMILALGLGGLFIFTTMIAVLSIGLPDVRDFDKLAGVESTIIFDREGGILYTIHGEENRKYVPISEISPFLQKATIGIEDDQFYEHSGFDIPGITAALLHEFLGIGVRRGGSTITQQLAKNAFLTRERTLLRKVKELILAIRLERAYDKEKILELYLNRIPYGGNAYGAELASKMYLGKSARDLTLGESIILAALPQAPTYYSPYGPNVYSKLTRDFSADTPKEKLPKTIQDLNEEDFSTGLIGKKISFSEKDSVYIPGRTDVILNRMQELELINKEERDQAYDEIQHTDFQKYQVNIRAAHFVFEIRSQLEQMFGKDFASKGGLRVYTTLDPRLQDAADKFIKDQIKISKDLHGVSTGALYSIDAKSGQVLAMVGSADYFDVEAHGSVNHVFAKRQPGSSFKPIVYAKVFLNQFAPATVIYDTPTNFGSGYEPQNYEGGFRGPMSIRQALGQSRNIPAIKAYFMGGGQDEIIKLANKMGIHTLKTTGDYGPALAIGAGEVTLEEMVHAFSVFANGGIKRNIYSILKIVDREGDVVYERKLENDKKEEVLDPQVAYLIDNILSDKSVYLGPRLDVAGHTTAAKTGTSNKEITPVKILPSNLWTVGFTPSIVTGVWAGNSDGSALKNNADGYNVAAPIWAKYMAEALKNMPDEPFIKPGGIKNVVVSKASGLLPSPSTPQSSRVSEVFASFSVPTTIDDMYQEAEVNKIDNMLPNEFTPEEHIEKKLFINHHDPIMVYPSWLEGIKKWIAIRRAEDSSYPDFPPHEKTTIFTAQTAAHKPTIRILSPAAFSVFTARVDIRVDVDISADNGVDRVTFFFDDRKLPSDILKRSPYTGKVSIPKNVTIGSHIITARIYDQVGYMAEAKIEIRYGTGPSETPPPESINAPSSDPLFPSLLDVPPIGQ